MPEGVCTRDVRATNRCRWIFACTCAGGFPFSRRRCRKAIAALVGQASMAGDALMPAFTHFRPAQPVLAAHYFLSHAAPLRRDVARLDGGARGRRCAPTRIGRHRRHELRHRRRSSSPPISVSAASSPTASMPRPIATLPPAFLFACSLTMVHLSRLSEDLIILCGDEYRFFELSDAISTGSSMMPQKKNPDPLELVRGKTGRAIGQLMALLTTLKGLPSGYNKDLQEDKHAVFDAEDTLAGCLAVVAAVIDGLTLNRARMAEASSGLLLATDAADYLVGRGVPFRRAHEIVGALVRKLVSDGRELTSLTPEEWRTASEFFAPDVVARVTAAASVAAKRTPQSTAPPAVRAALAEMEQWLESERGSR